MAHLVRPWIVRYVDAASHLRQLSAPRLAGLV
jgi:hypothetical protein